MPAAIRSCRYFESACVQDERTKELLRELAELHPEDPRQNCGKRSISMLRGA